MNRPSLSVIDHVRRPRNAGVLANPDAEGVAALDRRAPQIVLQLQVRSDTVVAARFQTLGCGYAIACSSVLTELVIGSSIRACRQLTPEHLAQALDGLPTTKEFCADLAIQALQSALTELSEQGNGCGT